MKYIKIDINKNNSIIEISKTEFLDLKSNEIQKETEYDFPLGQKPYFYRWDGTKVVVNDEDVIKSFSEELGTLLGLDLEPHIDSVVNGDFIPNMTKEIIINGMNFSPFSTVEISGDGNFVDSIYFISPQKIEATITVGEKEGLYNIIVYNNDLHSQAGGLNSILIKKRTVVDLRNILIDELGLEMTNGISVEQNNEMGLRFYSKIPSWNRGVKFSSYSWKRSDNITFEIIFTIISNVNFMAGIASLSLDVSNISSPYYKQEIGMYHNNNNFVSVYGGGDISNWSQNIGKTIILEKYVFYKLKLINSGGLNMKCSINKVESNDWDQETEIHSWISTCPADTEYLTPFIIPQAKSGDYYITGFRY